MERSYMPSRTIDIVRAQLGMSNNPSTQTTEKQISNSNYYNQFHKQPSCNTEAMTVVDNNMRRHRQPKSEFKGVAMVDGLPYMAIDIDIPGTEDDILMITDLSVLREYLQQNGMNVNSLIC
jgi:hypothetical protein